MDMVADLTMVTQGQVATITNEKGRLSETEIDCMAQEAERYRETVEDPHVQSVSTAMDIPVVQQMQPPTVQTVQKTVEIPQAQVSRHGCRHAFSDAAPGGHGSEGADDTRRAALAVHQRGGSHPGRGTETDAHG